MVDGQQVRCTFVHTNALDRVVGSSGTRRKASFSFQDGLIICFSILMPDEQELQRQRALHGPVFAWAREHSPGALALLRAFTYQGGAALARIAEAWRSAQPTSTRPGN